MAIAFVASRGTTTTTTAGFNPTVTMAAGGSIAVGNTLIMTVAADNSGTAGVDPNLWVVTSSVIASQIYGQDLRGNPWFRIARAVRNTGTANDGAVADIWACLVQNAYTNADAITLQFSFSVAGLAVNISEFSGVNPRSYSVVTATTGVGNGTSITAPAITPPTTGQLVVAVGAIETNTAITGDADTTNGSWVTLANSVANSGVDITSQTLFAQHKIVTASGAQNWTATKTGAADWAALAVVFDVFTNVASGIVIGNPNYPCIAGAEILPLGYDQLPIDTGTEYLQSHQVFPNSYGTQQYQASSFVLFDPAGSGASYAHHAVMNEVYLSGAENVQDNVFTQNLPIVAAGVGGGASVSSGAAAEAVAAIGGAYVILPNTGYVDVLFNPAFLTTLFFNYRVVRWGVQYLAWKDDGADASLGEGIIAEWRDSAANNGFGSQATISAWLVPNFKRDAQFVTRWIGETNPIIRGKGEILAQNAPYNAAFTVNDLSHMAAVDQTTRLRLYGAQGADPTQTTVYLDYIQAVVELVPERRIAHGSRLISYAPTFVSSHWYTDTLGATQMWSALNTNNRWQVPAVANTYVLTTREAMPASPADYYANQVSTSAGTIGRTVGYNEAIGPSFLFRAATEPRATLENTAMTGQPVLRVATIDGGVLAAPPREFDSFILSGSAYDYSRLAIDGALWPAYDASGDLGDFSQTYSGVDTVTRILVDGTTTFNRIKVLIYPDELTTANLTITVEKPILTVLATVTITPAQALALPDIGNGWREISAVLSVPVTPTAGQVSIRLSSTTPVAAPWRIAEANPIGSLDQFGYNSGQAQTDVAAVLECTLAVPSVTLGNSVQNIYRPNGRCLSTTITLPSITLTNGALYNWVSIERSLDAGATWTPVVLLQNTTNGQVYIDSAVPWDKTALTVTYRVMGYRNADHLAVTTVTAGWNAVATAPGTGGEFGLAAPNGTLYVYAPVDESSLEVKWNPLNPVEIVPLLGVDYQIPLRAPEERGLAVSFLIMIDQLLVCGTADTVPWTETLTPGAASLSPVPFDQLRGIEDTTRFSLLLPGGHSRFVTMQLGGLSIKTMMGIYLAEVTLTDTTSPDVSPYF